MTQCLMVKADEFEKKSSAKEMGKNIYYLYMTKYKRNNEFI